MNCCVDGCKNSATRLLNRNEIEYFDEEELENTTQSSDYDESIMQEAYCNEHFFKMYPKQKSEEEIESLSKKKEEKEAVQEVSEEKKTKKTGWW